MRSAILVAAICMTFATPAHSQTHNTQWPHNLEIGVRTFFDFGPPFDYYDIFLVKENQSGIAVERITLTPAADECFAPATVEKTAATLPVSLETLFREKNPCTIPESELRRERKRCKNCMVFSGADVLLSVQCGNRTRLIRSDILDRDMFDSSTKTPEHTSAAMSLVRSLNDAIGPSVMDKPIFPALNQAAQPIKEIDPEISRSLNAGEYDALFPNAREKPSVLLRASLATRPKPVSSLVSSSPFAPHSAPLPDYPRLALATHTEGDVTISLEINQSLGVGGVTVLTGHPLLRQAVVDAARAWVFAPEAQGKKTETTISFKLNCAPRPN